MIERRAWSAPPVSNTIHCIGDLHFGASAGTEFSLARRAIVMDDMSTGFVPGIQHHLQLDDLTNTAASQQDTDGLAWMDGLGGSKHLVFGNHDIWNVRNKQQCADAWGMPGPDYVTDLGFATLITIGPDAINPVNLTDLSYNLDFRSYEATRWGLTCWFAFCSGVA